MSWIRENRRTATLVALTLAVPLCLLLYLALQLLGMRSDYQQEIDRIEPRIARQQGLLERQDELAKSARRVDSEVLDLVYPASDDRAEVAAALQQAVREIMSSAGLRVTNSQILPAKEEGGFDRISVKLTVTGELDALDAALSAVASYMPLLLLESMELYPNRAGARSDGQETQAMTAALELLSLRVSQ